MTGPELADIIQEVADSNYEVAMILEGPKGKRSTSSETHIYVAAALHSIARKVRKLP